MGWIEALRRWVGPQPSDSDLEGRIAWESSRELGLGDYMEIPAVARGRGLIVSLASMLEPVAWRDGYPMTDQPSVLVRPAPGVTREQYLAELVGSLVDHGDAYCWQPRTGLTSDGRAGVSVVLPHGEVAVTWADDSRFLRRYWWQGRELTTGGRAPELLHISVLRQAGELTGHSPLEAIAGSLARILSAELYAGDWFETGAVPSITLRFDGALTDLEADRVRDKWMANHRDHSPAVLPKGWDTKESTVNPQASQLLETRRWGVLEVARGLGIVPAELLLAELGGSSLTYQNIADMLDTFMRVTVQPMYLAPIEASLSDLLPGTQAARFDASELNRLQTGARFTAYETGLRAGFLTTEQIDRWEGWDRGAPPVIPAALRPTPRPMEVPDAVAVP